VSILCGAFRTGAPYSLLEEIDGSLAVLRVIVPDLFKLDPEGFRMSWQQRRGHDSRVRKLIGEVVGKVKPDVIDYHVNRPLGEEALLALNEAGIPVVASLHDFWMICPRVTFMQSPANRPCSGPGVMKCLLCTYSHYDGRALAALVKLVWRVPRLGVGVAWKAHRRRLALKTVRAGMARSGVVSDAHAPFIRGSCDPILHGISSHAGVRPRERDRQGPFRFGFFAGSAPEKGLADVLAVVGRLRADGLDLELHVFGPGQVDSHPEMVLHGRFGADKRGAAYASVDIAVMATRMVEPRGRIPEEASVWGVPSIVPRIGGLVDVVRDEVDGLLYRFRDNADLERQMRRVVTQPELLKRLRRNLRDPPHLRDSLEEIEMVYRTAMESMIAGRRVR
jgi:glycosyltransferase involved in cell wall biosynthesis